MPALSKSQQSAAGMALAAKRGKIDPSKLRGSARQMYNSMTAQQLEDYASTSTKGLPNKVKKNRKK